MSDIAKAYVQIIPSAEGIQGSLTNLLSGEAESAGNKSGGLFGNAFSGAVKGGISAAKIGLDAIVGATAAAGAFGAASVKVGAEFDSAMSQVAATMGLTTDQLGELRDYAQEMGSTTAFSASQAADAMNILAMAGYDTESIMSTLPDILNMAAAGGLSIADAADYATGIIAGFSNETLTAGEIADKLATIASSAKGDVQSFGEGLSTVAGMANTTGQSMQDMTVALGILGNNNVAASEAGNALSRTLKNLYQPTNTAKAGLDALGVSAYDSVGNARPLQDVLTDLNKSLDGMNEEAKNQALSQIFDSATLKTVPALLNNAGKEWDELDAKLSNSSYNLADISSELANSGVAWEKYADAAWQTAGSGIEGLTDEIIYNIRDIGTSTEELQEYLQFEYNLDAEDALKAIQSVQTSLESSKGAAEAMADVQLDNLEGDITMFKSALEGAQIIVSDQLTPSLREFVSFGTDAISSLSGAFKEGGLSGAMDALGTIMTDGLKMLMKKLPELVKAGTSLVSSLLQGIKKNLPELAKGATQILTTLAQGILQILPEIIILGVQLLTELVNGITQSLPTLIPAAVEAIQTLITGLIENLPLLIEAGIQLLGALIQGIMESLPELVATVPEMIGGLTGNVTENLPELLESGKQMLFSIIDGLLEVLPDLIDNMGTILEDLLNLIMDNLPEMLDAGKDILMHIIQGISSKLPDILSSITTILQEFIKTIIDKLPDILESGVDILTELIQGITDTLPDLVSSAADLIVTIVNTLIEHLPEILSMGIDLLMELIGGITDTFPELISAAGDIISTIWDAITNIDWLELGAQIVNGIKDGLLEGLDIIADAAKDLANKALSAAKNALSIFSPSRVFRDEVGEMVALGMAEGIEENTDAVTDVIDEMSEATIDPAQANIRKVLEYDFSNPTWNGEDNRNNTAATLAEIAVLLKKIADKPGEVMIDGKTVGKVLSPIMTRQIAWEG